ncbi:hypothetical protein Bhyg_09879 [Pseudolycoriella hygida]|uniref:Uncharacterized protein n=1 Tax=Pseudolycoriella hygida TaxID=35572 RepID=A0A9Q0MVA2_9DIPT|nr:hypothetical protein Bhyg_09879 [Pseudolycoriella hygida]
MFAPNLLSANSLILSKELTTTFCQDVTKTKFTAWLEAVKCKEE